MKIPHNYAVVMFVGRTGLASSSPQARKGLYRQYAMSTGQPRLPEVHQHCRDSLTRCRSLFIHEENCSFKYHSAEQRSMKREGSPH